MWKMSIDANERPRFLLVPDAAGVAALDFLERSRDVASELVVDDVRAKTSPSARDKDTRSRTWPAV